MDRAICATCREVLDMSDYGEGGHIYPDGSVLCATCEAGDNRDKCHNCHTTNPDDDIQGGLCAKCFSALPEGEWHSAGTW